MKWTNFSLYSLVSFFLLIQSYSSNAQNNELGTGLIFDKRLYDSQEELPSTLGEKDGLPSSASLKEWTPRPKSQGHIGSCVGWATGYGMLTIIYSKLNNWTTIEERTSNAFSALFIYNNIKDFRAKDPCGEGTSFEKAINFLKEHGSCKSVEFDTLINDCYRKPNLELIKSAKKYKIKDAKIVFKSDDIGAIKTRKVKKRLATGNPVLIGMRIRQNLRTPTTNFWIPTEGQTQSAGDHAMVIVGYDNALGAFEVMNSWGKGWGNEGFLWIKYEDFEEYAISAYTFIINEKTIEPNQNVSYKGAFDFRIPHIYSKENIVFETLQPYKTGLYSYELKKKDWVKNSKYQILVKQSQAGYTAYVFSIDDIEYNIHWPRKKSYNLKYGYLGGGESEYIPYKNARIVIPPGKDSILKKQTSGNDYIIMLYAYKEIPDFKMRVEKVYNAKGNIEERLKEGFKDLMLPTSVVKYDMNKMKFSGKYSDKKYVIPVVLTIEGK